MQSFCEFPCKMHLTYSLTLSSLTKMPYAGSLALDLDCASMRFTGRYRVYVLCDQRKARCASWLPFYGPLPIMPARHWPLRLEYIRRRTTPPFLLKSKRSTMSTTSSLSVIVSTHRAWRYVFHRYLVGTINLLVLCLCGMCAN